MNIHIFDRSNLDEVIGWQDGKNITRREDLAVSFPRSDVAMINFERECSECGHHTKLVQKCLYVANVGYCGDIEVLNHLSPEQRVELDGIAERMRQNAIDFPLASKYIHRY